MDSFWQLQSFTREIALLQRKGRGAGRELSGVRYGLAQRTKICTKWQGYNALFRDKEQECKGAVTPAAPQKRC